MNKLFSRDRYHFLDGAMGTMLQGAALAPGEKPEVLAVKNPDLLTEIHRKYLSAGSEIVYANTFGASALQLSGSGFTPEELIPAAIAAARRAAQDFPGALVALDIGPLGALLEPSGDLSFDEAYSLFAQMVKAGQSADLIVFETFTDLYELKAALLAAKENSRLPVMCSMSFERGGRTFSGCPVESFAQTVVGLGADAVGINCSLGPDEIFPIAKRLCSATPENFPVFIKPNAGLPHADGSGYDITPESFAEKMQAYLDLGITMVGGCCGTTPDFIKALHAVFADKIPPHKPSSGKSYVCSALEAVEVSGITVVGERINPTGKKTLQAALRAGDIDYILSQAHEQAQAGAQILDVNVGLPDIDEAEMLTRAVKALQAAVSLPLQLDSASADALESALRVYNGKPIVNSVNGDDESLAKVLPLCKKYGAAVVGLTLDSRGVPESADERVKIAKKICDAALNCGIAKEDIYIDCLTLTVSAQPEAAAQTLEALRRCKAELGVKTILGVSNISFGLPCRGYVNTAFLTLAMQAGLDLAIMNPNTEEMIAAVRAYRVLTRTDIDAQDYISRYAGASPAANSVPKAKPTLFDAVVSGLKADAASAAKKALQALTPMEIVDTLLIPALDEVGKGYESGRLFLPQLLRAAEAAQSAFTVLRGAMTADGGDTCSKGKIILATVKGDVHDIGKNIVKVVLENYGFEVTDLGRDTPPEAVLAAVTETGAGLVGLSALMTTTLPAMAETVALLREKSPNTQVMIGGAVVTPEYAQRIGAHFYGADAKQAADIAKTVFAI